MDRLSVPQLTTRAALVPGARLAAPKPRPAAREPVYIALEMPS